MGLKKRRAENLPPTGRDRGPGHSPPPRSGERSAAKEGANERSLCAPDVTTVRLALIFRFQLEEDIVSCMKRLLVSLRSRRNSI